jgi:hypothetical protein
MLITKYRHTAQQPHAGTELADTGICRYIGSEARQHEHRNSPFRIQAEKIAKKDTKDRKDIVYSSSAEKKVVWNASHRHL